MSELSGGRGRTASARLLDVAGPEMYLRNPFRITGLATDATGRQVRERRQLVLSVLATGAAAPIGDTRLPVPSTSSADDVRAAFDQLDKTEFRLVDELFWWWGEPGKCGCAKQTHRLHDEAVAAHAEVLDLEKTSGGTPALRAGKWAEAARAWSEALRHKDFWSHLEHRVRALADRRLDQSTVAGLRGSVAHALLAPQIALAATTSEPGQVGKLLEEWDFDRTTLDDALAAAAAHAYDHVDALSQELAQLLDDGHLDVTADRILEELVPAAGRLDQLVPHQRFRRSAMVRGRVAMMANNAGMELMGVPAEAGGKRVERLLDEAEKLVIDEETLTTVHNNQEFWRSERALIAATGVADPWKEVNTLLEGQQFLAAAPLLLSLRKALDDPLLRARVSGMLDGIRMVRARSGVVDLSGVAGNLMTFAASTACMALLLLVFGTLPDPVPGAWLGIGVLSPIMFAWLATDWFLAKPMQLPKWVGTFSLLAAIGLLVFAVAMAGLPSLVGVVVIFGFTLVYARSVGRALARRWNDR